MVVARRLLARSAQRGDEGVNAATQILQIHQQHVEGIKHCRRGATYFTVQAENGNAVLRVDDIG